MNDQTTCTNWAEMLAISHPEEDLSPSEFAALEEHVSHCSTCAAVRDNYKVMTAKVRTLPGVKPLSSSSVEFLYVQKGQYKGEDHPNVVVTYMNCAQVGEQLSAYLDNILAPEERRQVAAHVQTCPSCSEALADYRRNDILLTRLPRVAPDDALREHIFSSLEFLEMTDAAQENEAPVEWTIPKISSRSPRRDTVGNPYLVAVPGKRSTVPLPIVRIAAGTSPRRRSFGYRLKNAAIAAALIVAVGIGALVGVSTLHYRTSTSNAAGTPIESGPQGSGPLSVGIRFVFLLDGTLWSELADGSSVQADRLTPNNVTVAPGWVVATLPGKSTGNMLAYIDLKKASVHVIRSDGQEDTPIRQPLLKVSVSSASAWETDAGARILNSLTWSPDGSKLAFVGDPDNTGQTHLYLYSPTTDKTIQVVVTTPGSVSHPTWSSDGIGVAFEVSQQGVTNILDYNTQTNDTLLIADGIGSKSTAGQSVLTLDWSPNIDTPAITWSVGSIDHVRGIWIHHVGVDSAAGAQEILPGDFAQAIYSRSGHAGTGSWLIITSTAGWAGDIWRIDISPGSTFTQLTRGRQVNFAEWSPDGSSIGYLDSLSEGVGTFRIVNANTAVDAAVANGVTYKPAPAWSLDSQQVAFSTGTRIGIASVQNPGAPRYLTLKGVASALSWSESATSPHQLVVAMNDMQQGIYLVDTQQNSVIQVDKLGAEGSLLWTEIP